MDVEIHPNAKKHLTEKQVLGAWFAVTECIRRESEDEPPRWLAIGWLPDGRSVELVAVELIRGWLIIHALSPVQKKFWQEIVRGRPPLSGEGTATLSVKIPLGMKEAIRRRAAAEGMTPSEFARAALSEKLLAAG